MVGIESGGGAVSCEDDFQYVATVEPTLTSRPIWWEAGMLNSPTRQWIAEILAARPAILTCPSSFDGPLPDFHTQYVLPNLLDPSMVQYYHELLMEHCSWTDYSNRACGFGYRKNGGSRNRLDRRCTSRGLATASRPQTTRRRGGCTRLWPPD